MPCIVRGSGMQVREFETTGAPLTVQEIPNVPGTLGYATVGNSLVSLRDNGSLEAINLDTKQIRALGNIGSDPLAAVMYPLNGSELFIVNRAEARFVRLDLLSGSKTAVSLDSADIVASKRFFSSEPSSQTATGAVTRRSLIASGMPDARGMFYCVVFPLRRQHGALTLRASMDGRIAERLSLELPERSAQPGLPNQLVTHNDELYVVFPNGEVLVYPT
ncbi:MAG: hypothetical protein ABI693_26725 [Bryobacteraceae bacterium]